MFRTCIHNIKRGRLPSSHNSRKSFGLPGINFSFSTLRDCYDNILVSKHYVPQRKEEESTAITGSSGLGVGLVTLNRPKAFNALSDALFDDLIHALRALDSDNSIGVLVVTGKGKAFAAGADIAEMSSKGFSESYKNNMFAQWADITRLSKPIIAAVNGLALGGGCELAMMCDLIVASDNAKFGQPEINLGIIPGAGGTQRLIRAVGKSKAMEMILTGSTISAEKAERDGLVARVCERDKLMEEVIDMGLIIGSKGQVAVMMAKEAVNAAEQMTLDQGLLFERRLFHSLFATKDQKEGMTAFMKKNKPSFTNE